MFKSFKTVPPSSTPTDTDSHDTYQQPSSPAWNSIHDEAPAPAPEVPSFTAQSPMTRAPQSITRNVLNSDVEVVGTLRFVDDLLIDGYVEGKIFSDGILTIGENAEIKAEINTKSVTIHGKVIGNITVTDRVELKASAELVGDIKAAQLSVEAGAIFIGRSTVGVPSTSIPLPQEPEISSVKQSEFTVDDIPPSSFVSGE
ncbi:polymer-forming cytoskeletal protein [Akkermansia sp. N21169]|uniref:bactofilin family protein n=1 Tax=Akkermansia sp. N21169 TaxID=3040765 RepID=UPI00244E7F79|nr:polymer-forming cytoskeletal protein [Akkermansia sp. N21169]MDH3068951.1 polymer-forming cytoskeletal protein [Akkermansia sp. N21169]